MFLQQQVDAEEQHVERQRAYHQSHAHHYRHREPQEPRRASAVGGRGFRLQPVGLQVAHKLLVGGRGQLHGDARRLVRAFGAQPLVGVDEERAGHQNRVERVGETYHPAFHVPASRGAAQHEVNAYHPYHALGERWQAACPGIAEIVQVEVAAGQDDGQCVAAFAVVPARQVGIDVLVGQRLEEHFRAHTQRAARLHRRVHPEARRDEGGRAGHEGLARQVSQLPLAEVRLRNAERLQGTHAARHHGNLFLHEAVAALQHGAYVAVELETAEHNAQAQQVGQEKSRHLRHADVAVEQFEHKSQTGAGNQETEGREHGEK